MPKPPHDDSIGPTLESRGSRVEFVMSIDLLVTMAHCTKTSLPDSYRIEWAVTIQNSMLDEDRNIRTVLSHPG